jgi:hypothetical protein
MGSSLPIAVASAAIAALLWAGAVAVVRLTSRLPKIGKPSARAAGLATIAAGLLAVALVAGFAITTSDRGRGTRVRSEGSSPTAPASLERGGSAGSPPTRSEPPPDDLPPPIAVVTTPPGFVTVEGTDR